MTKALESSALVSDFEWTLERYHEAVENGTFRPADKLELLKGKLVKKRSINAPHATCLKIITKYFNRRYLDQYELMSENPITLPSDSEPEPDFAVVDLDEKDYQGGHPTVDKVHLLIEIAEQSLRRDQIHKARIYAEAGIKEYWIVNLRQKKVEVHLSPDQESGNYESINHYKRGQIFESPFCGSTAVDDLLPNK